MELCTKTDFLAIQEHWFYQFESKQLCEILPDFNCNIHCADDSEPISAQQRPGGKGGVAILWRKKFDEVIKSLDDGNERIVTVELQTSTDPYIIISVYLPTRGYTTSKSDFLYHVSILSAIIEKYRATHQICILGDFNASLHRNEPCDRILQDFVQSHHLCVDQIQQPTFIHHAGIASSKIDYIMWTSAINVAKIEILDHNSSNTSAHLPLLMILNVALTTAKKDTGSNQKPVLKYQWNKADLLAYEEMVDCNLLRWLHTHSTLDSTAEIDIATEAFIDALIEAADATVPKKTVKFRGPRFRAPPDLLDALQESRTAFCDWDDAGKPTAGHPTHTKMRSAKKIVRSQLRQINAMKRTNFYQKLMQNPGSQEFHQLLNYQLKNSKASTDVLIANNKRITEPAAQSEALADHYCQLSTPSDCPEYNSTYYQDVQRDNAWLFHLIDSQKSSDPVTIEEVYTALESLHPNKAADSNCLVAEHLFNAKNATAPVLSILFNAMQHTHHIPTVLKSGYILSMPKKGKDPKLPSGHRGITITSALSKVLESVYKTRHETTQLPCQEDLQLGFTEGSSPLMAALIVTEAIGEAKVLKSNLFIASADVRKAFDVVDHSIAFHTLFEENCELTTIGTVKELYSGLQNHVLWHGNSSKTFEVKQGVRQGGVWSSSLYKSYVNPLLAQFRRSELGLKIGTIYVGTPTVADDLLMVSLCSEETQCMFDVLETFADKRRYGLNSDKSAVLMVTPTSAQKPSDVEWTLHGDTVTPSDGLTHVGVVPHASHIQKL